LAGSDPEPIDNLTEQERQSWVRQSVELLPDPMR
jgi:hypothetical protein